MAHPTGIIVDIVGIKACSSGRSCEEHDVCGIVLQEDTVVRIRHVQILVDGLEESALAVYWISDGVDCCHVGFLPHHLLKHWKEYDGRIAQIIEMYEESESPTKRRKNYKNLGCCQGVLIDTVCDDFAQPMKHQQTKGKDDEEERKKQVAKRKKKGRTKRNKKKLENEQDGSEEKGQDRKNDLVL
jgi:hypothetical protein